MTEMLQYMLPYLDKHLALGLLSFHQDRGADVAEVIEHLLSHTALTMEGNVKPEQEGKIKEKTAVAKPALDAFFDQTPGEEFTYQLKLTASEVDQMRTQGELSLEVLRETKGITKSVMVAVMELAFLFYDQGSYEDASELLALCQCVSGFDLPTDTLLWGKLVCDIGAFNWQSAIEVAAQIRKNQNANDDEIFREARSTTVRARAWLLHWVLFCFFKGGNQYPINLLYYVFDYRINNVYQSVVETVCPHYLRYICAAALLNRSRYASFRSAAAMAEKIYEYSDALTELIVLIHNSSFNAALALLPKVQEVIREDYFLCDFEEELLSSAKRMIFQKYMAIHSVVSIPYVAEKLEMSKKDAEVWLVNLISDSKQRAKIDSVNEQLNVESQARAVESIVYDKIESASRR